MPRVNPLSTSGSTARSPEDSTTSGYGSRSHPPSPETGMAVNPRVGAAAPRGPQLALSVVRHAAQPSRAGSAHAPPRQRPAAGSVRRSSDHRGAARSFDLAVGASDP